MVMTIDEAIEHAREVAEENRKDVIKIENNVYSLTSIDKDALIDICRKCAEEHEQLARWLEDYKKLKKKWLEADAYNEGFIDGRAETEEEVENRFNRVLDDEKRISYEQGRADERKKIMDIVDSAEDNAHAMFLLGQYFMTEQLKGQK